MNIIVAPCFTTVPCPQRHVQVCVSEAILGPWCESVHAAGCQGVVLYDMLPGTLIKRYADVRFIRVDPPRDGYSINDWRLLCYRSLLQQMSLVVEAAFFTDLFDMVVQHDPFPWLQSRGEGLAFGIEDALASTECIMTRLDLAFGPDWRSVVNPSLPVVTCGLFGGTHKLLLGFLETACGLLTSIRAGGCTDNVNMAVMAMTAHACMCGRNRHFGFPLHHPCWRQGQRDANSFFHHTWHGDHPPWFP